MLEGVAVTLNPELLPSLAYETIKAEAMVVLLQADPPMAAGKDVSVSAFAGIPCNALRVRPPAWRELRKFEAFCRERDDENHRLPPASTGLGPYAAPCNPH